MSYLKLEFCFLLMMMLLLNVLRTLYDDDHHTVALCTAQFYRTLEFHFISFHLSYSELLFRRAVKSREPPTQA